MASLIISAAVNIAVGLLINELFPPPDIEQEGPRLTELGFTSAAYGKHVNIVFGTDRISGNIIDTEDPAIEEVVTKETSSAGKGGGQDVNTTTYTYFLTCRISWCIEGADELIRLWGDGKTIIDAGSTGQLVKAGVTHTFYPGGITQLQDPEEVTRRNADIPAYGHLTSSKLDRMPLADYGNRIPNFTAEISFNAVISVPFLELAEPAGLDVPGGPTGSDISHMMFNPDRNEFYSLKENTGTWVANATSVSILSLFDGEADGAVGFDGNHYGSSAASNTNPLRKIDIETGTVIQSFGETNTSVSDHENAAPLEPDFENTGSWSHLTVTLPGVGVRGYAAHLSDFTAQNGSIVGTTGSMKYLHTISPTDDVHPVFGDAGNQLHTFGEMIPDHDRGVFYYIGPESPTATFYRMVEFKPTQAIGLGGVIDTGVEVRTVRTFTIGVDITGTGNVRGWAVNKVTGDIMWSNGTEVMLYNPLTDTVLARTTTGAGSFQGTNNYYSGSIFAWMDSSVSNTGFLRIYDTRTLEVIRSVNTNTIGWPTTGGSNDTVVHLPSQCWDDRVQAIYLSRTGPGSGAPVGSRVLKIFVNRVGIEGVGLDTVVSALSTSYQRQKMAGLLPEDIDVTTLAGDLVQGYTLNRPSTMKSALQPLRDRYLFDAHQSDWIIKFPKRGASPLVTIPEEDVGILKRGRSMTDEPAVREVRQDDLSLPMSLSIRYRNKDTDYQTDTEQHKRHLFPSPTMRSKTERNINIPIVDTSTPMKRLAEKTLYTLWNERVSYKTIVPWTYLALDATDVFSMGVFNETHQLRMAENDLGQGWAIELTGVVEDTKSFSSTLSGGAGLGHVGTTVPSSLPTRIFPLDAPILSLVDLLATPISNAYMAVGAFEDSWSGASVMKSADDVAYLTTGTVNQEAATAKVRVAPGVWNIRDGNPDNRWQEVEDGGSMTVTPLRRADEWVSTTEELLLSGANTVAVIRASDSQVEIFNFQNATLNDDNTVDLTRLLRGRLGTEDIADLGITAGDTCILLANAANVKEDGPIVRQRLVLSELDTGLFFKGVTVGTLIEDAPVTSFIYTGRDIRPYFPVEQKAASDGLGGLDITWERRARGPLAAEWLDGTGEVVLNETIERYRVALSAAGNPRFIVKSIDDARLANFTQTEVALGGVGGSFADAIMPVRQGFTEPDGDFGGVTAPLSGGWVEEDSTGAVSICSSNTGISGPPSESGNSTFMCMAQQLPFDGPTGLISYELDIVDDLGLSLDNITDITFTCNLMIAMHQATTDVPEAVVLAAMYDDSNNNLAQASTGVFNLSTAGIEADGSWTRVGSGPTVDYPLSVGNELPLRITGVAGATKLRVRIQLRNSTAATTSFFGIDVIRISALWVTEGITAEVETESETGRFSPVSIRQVT